MRLDVPGDKPLLFFRVPHKDLERPAVSGPGRVRSGAGNRVGVEHTKPPGHGGLGCGGIGEGVYAQRRQGMAAFWLLSFLLRLAFEALYPLPSRQVGTTADAVCPIF